MNGDNLYRLGHRGPEKKTAEKGESAVKISDAIQKLKAKEQAVRVESQMIRYKEDKTFYLKGDYWVDSEYKKCSLLKEIKFNSKEYYQLISEKPGQE